VIDRGVSLAVAGLVLLSAGCGLPVGNAQGAADAQPLASLPTHSVAVTPGSSPTTGSAGPSPSTVVRSPVAGPKGSTLVSDTANGFSLILPPGYTKLANLKDLDAALARSKDALKLTPAQIAQFRTAMQQNVRLFGVNFLTGASLNMLVVPANGEQASTLTSDIPSIKAQLAAVHATDVKVVRATVAARPGLRATASLKTPSGTFTEVQLYTIANDKVYILTISGRPTKATDLALITRSLQVTAPVV
jgi:hypothetical protein